MQKVRDQIVWKYVEDILIKGCFKMEINSKTFAILILTAILSTNNQMQSEQGKQMLYNLFPFYNNPLAISSPYFHTI